MSTKKINQEPLALLLGDRHHLQSLGIHYLEMDDHDRYIAIELAIKAIDGLTYNLFISGSKLAKIGVSSPQPYRMVLKPTGNITVPMPRSK